MKIIFSKQAQKSLKDIAKYLLDSEVERGFVRSYLESIKDEIVGLLSIFPKSGVIVRVNNYECRKIVIKGYSVLYELDETSLIVLLLYRENLPKLWEQ